MLSWLIDRVIDFEIALDWIGDQLLAFRMDLGVLKHFGWRTFRRRRRNARKQAKLWRSIERGNREA